MRTAESIIGITFYPHECGSMIDCVTKQDAIKAINEARKEAIEECAKKATLESYSYHTGGGTFGHENMGQEVTLGESSVYISVDQKSILSLIDELK